MSFHIWQGSRLHLSFHTWQGSRLGLSEGQVAYLLSSTDKDADGFIDYVEFTNAFFEVSELPYMATAQFGNPSA